MADKQLHGEYVYSYKVANKRAAKLADLYNRRMKEDHEKNPPPYPVPKFSRARVIDMLVGLEYAKEEKKGSFKKTS
jgi:hypothetical protein